MQDQDYELLIFSIFTMFFTGFTDCDWLAPHKVQKSFAIGDLNETCSQNMHVTLKHNRTSQSTGVLLSHGTDTNLTSDLPKKSHI